MAIYRFEAKVISRGGGRSSVAAASYRTGKCATSAAAYRAGAELVDEQTGKTYNYTNKRGVLGAEILAPDGAVPWMRDRQKLWNAVELIEKRRDAQLARDFILTLPHEMTHEQRAALTREFVREQFCARGLIADVAWHAPGKGDDRNYHAHVMVPMRVIEGDGFARRKDRPSGPDHPAKAWAAELMRLRVEWAATANRHLEAAGLEIRLDHRSLNERGIEREPEPKQGPLATVIEQEGRVSLAGQDRRDVQARNAERAALKAEHARAQSDIITLTAQSPGSSGMIDQPEELARDQEARIKEAVREIQEREEKARAFLRREAEAALKVTEAFKVESERMAAQARSSLEARQAEEKKRQVDGQISSAEARYAIAIGETAGPDVYTNLIRAAGQESAAFLRSQEAMRMQLADPKLVEAQRQELVFRKEIEFCEYRALTDQRLSGMYRVIGGEAHHREAEFREQLAKAATERAVDLREQRRNFLWTQEQEKARDAAGTPKRADEHTQATQQAQPTPAPSKSTELPREMSAAERIMQEKIAAMAREDRAIDAARTSRQAGRETSSPHPETVRQQDTREAQKIEPSRSSRQEQQRQPEQGMSAADRAKAERIAAMEREDRAADASRSLHVPREIAMPGQVEQETGRQKERREERQEASAQPSKREQPERVMSEREQAKAARIAGMVQEDRVIDQSRENRNRGDGRDRSEGR